MGGGREFDLVRVLADAWGPLAVGLGDDAALLAPAPAGTVQVVSTDASVEEVHYRERWIADGRITPHDVGERAAAAALSDLAAMGATASAMLVSLTVPERWRERLPELARGIGVVTAGAGARIVGGNLARGTLFTVTLTVIGHAPRPAPRSGARPGDLLVVTGVLGGPRTALEALERGEGITGWAGDRFRSPRPRLEAGQVLAAAGATAMIDISDGLAGDAAHLAAASGVLLEIDPGRVPSGDGGFAHALVSGEEYELLATIPADAAPGLVAGFERRHGIPLTVVGTVRAPDGAPGVRLLIAPGGPVTSRVEFASGHDHFSQ